MQQSPRRIVVGIDGSPPSERALDWAIGEAQRTGTQLFLLTAWRSPTAFGHTFASTQPQVHQLAQEGIDKATAHIHAIAPDVEVRGETVEHQSAAAALTDAAAEDDLLVVGRRGHGSFDDMHVGSVSEHCVRQARCSVVVVR